MHARSGASGAFMPEAPAPRCRFRRLCRSAVLPLAALLLGSALCCQRQPDAVDRAEVLVSSLEDVVVWGETITLEENDDVINVHPRVTADRSGGYLVTDMGEYQVRGYDAAGRLRFHYGSQGPAPGQFTVPPMGALRRPDGTVLVGDFQGRIARVDDATLEELAVARPPLQVLYGMEPLPGDSLVLLMGRHRDAPHTLLHVYDPVGGTIRQSFFPTPLDAARDRQLFFAGHAHAQWRGDVIAAVFALDSAVHFFGLDGVARGVVPLPRSGFRPARGEPRTATGAGVVEWLETFSRLSEVYWLDDRSLVVQYYDMDGMTPVWSVVGMTLDGRKLFEVIHSPRLLARGAADGEALFVHPDSETPDKWIVARFAGLSH